MNCAHDPAYGHVQVTLRTVVLLPGTVPTPTENQRPGPHIPPTRISVKDTPIRYMRIILIKQKLKHRKIIIWNNEECQGYGDGQS